MKNDYLICKQTSYFKMARFSIEENKHTCQLCGYQTSQKKKLKLHEKAIHEGKRFQCNQCDYQTSKKSSFVTHNQAVHMEIIYSCDQCDYQATNKSNLKTHKQSVHMEIKFQCPTCNYQAAWKKHSGRIASCEDRLILADLHIPFHKTTNSYIRLSSLAKFQFSS
jgi:hypothetical protein